MYFEMDKKLFDGIHDMAYLFYKLFVKFASVDCSTERHFDMYQKWNFDIKFHQNRGGSS